MLTAEVWELPSWIAEKDPTQQHAHVVVEPLEVPAECQEYNAEGFSFAKVLHNVLTPDQCQSLIQRINQKGFTPALLNIGRGNQMLCPETRDGHRAIVDSPTFARYLLEAIRPHLPEQCSVRGSEGHLVSLNERLRFLCYTPGQTFEPHCDGMYCRPPDHPQAGAASMVTLQLYLHDVPAEHGGATTFLPLNSSQGNERGVPCHPRCGSVLLFSQDLYHEGSRVHKGLKYTMRTEAMYQTR